MKYSQHPLSASFPSMSQADFTALVDDIKANGQRDPIVVIGQEILDGWHRYSACQQIGVEPAVEAFDGSDPRAFVLSRNLHRRHLSGSQRAAAIVACGNWRASGSNQHTDSRGGEPSSPPTMTNEQMADEAKVSKRVIQHAKVATAAGLNHLVAEGKITAKRAAEIAKLPESKREAAINDPSVHATRKKAKPAKAEKELERVNAKAEQLAEQVESLTDAVQEAGRLEAENAKLRALVGGENEAEAHIDDLLKQIEGLESELRRMTADRDRLMDENAQLKKQIRSMQFKMDKAA